ncbi:MAG: hypothetical protein WBN96_12805 [Gammaproteobacteria bacterium]
MIRQITTSFMLVALSLLAAPVSALTVYADLDGDTFFDSQGTYNPGDIFTAGIFAEVDDVHGGLAGFGVRMSFTEPPISVNAVPAQLDNVSIDPVWNFIPLKSVGVGFVTAGGSQLFSSSTGIVHLFDVTFRAGAQGISILTMTDEIPNFGDFAGLDGFDYDASGELIFLTTEIKVIPVPPALMLFGSGLLGLISFARRRQLNG